MMVARGERIKYSVPGGRAGEPPSWRKQPSAGKQRTARPTVGGALDRDVGAASAANGGAAELHRHLDRVAGAIDRDNLQY